MAAKTPTNRDFISCERFEENEGSPLIRLASTVMLLRPAGSSFEVFMLRRSATSAFAPDVYVFPGGTVDPDDYAVPPQISGLDEDRIARMFRAERTPLLDDAGTGLLAQADFRALVVAALREVFEESGVLLGAEGIGHVDSAQLHALRGDLFERKISFEELLARLDVQINAGGLEFFSQWITPPSEGRRFNAHFFVARADSQAAIADRQETHDEVWISPRVALERYAAGSYAMVYPTIKHVERLAQFTSLDEVMAFAKKKPILRIMPHTHAGDGFTLPNELEQAW